jgi:hypothetical protein
LFDDVVGSLNVWKEPEIDFVPGVASWCDEACNGLFEMWLANQRMYWSAQAKLNWKRNDVMSTTHHYTLGQPPLVTFNG